MEAIQLTESLIQTAETEKQTRVRKRGQEALYKGAVVMGFGVMVYGGFWLYDFFSKVNINLQHALSEVIASEQPPVHPALGRENKDTWGLLYQDVFSRKGALYAAGWWSDMIVYRQKVNNDGSLLPCQNDCVRWLKRQERRLIELGVIKPQDIIKEHPVDSAAGFVLKNKWYWGGVIGLATLPALSVLKQVVKRG